MASGKQFIDKGIEVIKEAGEKDEANDKEAAFQLYKQGLDLLSSGLKYEKNKKAKQIIQQKMIQYLDRAEQLSKELQIEQSGGKKAANIERKSSSEKKNGVPEQKADKKEDDPETKKLQGALANAIVTETPNVKWDDVAGLEVAKGLLKEAVLLPIKFPQLFIGKRTPWKGILLYGPPGTGKSFLAKEVATEAGASTFFSVSSSDLVSKYQGESERLVKNLFEMARAKSPAIIFIDEIDSLCGSRSDGENDSARRIKTEFLVQMQGVGKGNDGILVLGATNTPWDLDPAIRRRFEKRIYIPLPDVEARETMFHIHIGDTPNDLDNDDYKYFAQRTDGFSGADISVIVRDALMEPVRFLPEATHFRRNQNGLFEPCSPGEPDAVKIDLMQIEGNMLEPPVIALRDFVRALDNAKPSVNSRDLDRQIAWTQEFGQEG